MDAQIAGYRFDAYVVDVQSRRLLKNGRAVGVSAKIFDIIALLAASAGSIVSRQHLVAHIWNGESVREDNIDQHIRLARIALDDRTKPYKYIRTVQSRGYCFGAQVKRVRSEAESAPEDMARTSAFAALALLNAAVDIERIGTTAALDAGAACLERATLLDPFSAPVAARVAWSHVRRAISTFEDARTPLHVAREALARALQLDPSDPQAIATRAALLLFADRNPDAAIESLLRARSAGMRTEKQSALLVQAYVAGEMHTEARAEARKALAAFPGSGLAQYFAAFAHYYSGDIELAAAQARQVIAMRPACGAAHFMLALTSICQGNMHGARQRLNALLLARAPLVASHARMRAPAIAALAYVAAREGDRIEARALVQDLRMLNTASACCEALAAIGLGEPSDVVTWLTRAYERQEPWSLFFSFDPLYMRWKASERDDLLQRQLRAV